MNSYSGDTKIVRTIDVSHINIEPLRKEEIELLDQMDRGWAKGRPLALYIDPDGQQQVQNDVLVYFVKLLSREVSHG